MEGKKSKKNIKYVFLLQSLVLRIHLKEITS